MIIAFAGRKQSGKTTCALFLEQVYRSYTVATTKIYNFADPLKSLCIDILGLEHVQCYGSDEDKNQLVNCYLDNRQLSAREVLQIVGTDMFRNIQQNVWSDATIRLIKKDNPDLAIIADCRFPNEVSAVKNAGGIVIKLNRNPYNSNHASEKALDADQYNQSFFDLSLDNQNMSIEQQNNEIYKFFHKQGLLPL